ncbi:hypothetical protein ABFS82_04G146000 [Erythranthe guttata]|uniref:WRKY domain-containing protein n=2 Tax=Erythranthe guttata TaxID=4155 RepID=A0A022QAP8_ERYGU|nr:PREDICTED: uncharacterized protein LOC105973575 isoform X2 [Erythranthe guttata]EYU23595.1 hypothetical protein MIMGU_mgv1a008753mg [Erythranthe guttata]|eukprot:XP_012854063.1 PREDICTED: uncharacterized protein LOC105973575 isoform X2 [Erythranthe guttata]
MLDKASMESSYSMSGEQLADYDAHNTNSTTLEDLQPCLEIEDSFFVNLENQLVQQAANTLSRIKDFKSTLDSLQRNVESLIAKASAVQREIKIPILWRRKNTGQCKVTAFLEDDGHAWKKFGQKTVLGSKHPRNYFRCARRYVEGCLATKQVQKIQDDPPLFRITCFGQHSCNDFLKSSDQINMDVVAATPEDSSSVIIDAAATIDDTLFSFINSFDDDKEKSSSPPPPPLSSHDLDSTITSGDSSVTVANWLVEVQKLETEFLELDNEVKSQGLEENMENIEQLNQRVETLVEESTHFSEVLVDAYRKVNVIEKPTKNAELSVHKKRRILLEDAKVSEGGLLSLENKAGSEGSVCNQPNNLT